MKNKSSPENPATFLPPASDGFEYVEFSLWVANLHGQFYLLFYALVIFFSQA
jgi:hypothetical protein